MKQVWREMWIFASRLITAKGVWFLNLDYTITTNLSVSDAYITVSIYLIIKIKLCKKRGCSELMHNHLMIC